MSLRDQLQLTLGTAYTITRELGGGGMSRVFVARDETLGRDVVVKVLRSDFAIELSAERFAREIRLAARLQQANIVPVLHAGEADGLPYYTMPFIEGASLRARLDRGPVPHVEAMHIVCDVARALAYAHGHGVVHRDIKPENVLLSAGTAVVTDFGIAKAIEHARDASAPGNLTGGGVQIGTPAYMAPEQAAGDVVDARADVYAWGMLAYELLAGQHPFADKRTSYELIAAHFTEIPAPLTDGGITPQLAGLVASCLSKRPDERPPNGAALLATRDATSESGVSSARLRIGSESKPSAPGSPKPSIAVLPFENMSADPENQYFADGVAEEITNALARLRDLRVAARMSAFSFRGTREDVRAVGERLGVATVPRRQRTTRWRSPTDYRATHFGLGWVYPLERALRPTGPRYL